ncbi:hypothetical protein NL676_036227 [Syzygium grande]|nr:hypothetical protein NL676_036227 [Syzygium grande]
MSRRIGRAPRYSDGSLGFPGFFLWTGVVARRDSCRARAGPFLLSPSASVARDGDGVVLYESHRSIDRASRAFRSI